MSKKKPQAVIKNEKRRGFSFFLSPIGFFTYEIGFLLINIGFLELYFCYFKEEKEYFLSFAIQKHNSSCSFLNKISFTIAIGVRKQRIFKHKTAKHKLYFNNRRQKLRSLIQNPLVLSFVPSIHY